MHCRSLSLALLPLLVLGACGGGGGGGGQKIVMDYESLAPLFTGVVAIQGGQPGIDGAATWTAGQAGFLERLELYIAPYVGGPDEPVVLAEVWETDFEGKPFTSDPSKRLATFDIPLSRLPSEHRFSYIPFDLRAQNVEIQAGRVYAIVLRRGLLENADVTWFGDGTVDTSGGATWTRESGDWGLQEQEDLAMRVFLEIED